MVEDGRERQCNAVGNDKLQETAPGYELKAARYACIVEGLTLLKLRKKVVTTLNRARKEFHEKQHIQREVGQTVFGFFLPVNLYQIGKRLKRVERDAYWEHTRPVTGEQPEACQPYNAERKQPCSGTTVQMAVNGPAHIEGKQRNTERHNKVLPVIKSDENTARQQQYRMLPDP